jgi:hypothetical protein
MAVDRGGGEVGDDIPVDNTSEEPAVWPVARSTTRIDHRRAGQ